MKMDKLAERVAAGKNLYELKQRIGHGNFVTWVESKCPFSYRTAHRNMCLYKAVEEMARQSEEMATILTLADLLNDELNDHEISANLADIATRLKQSMAAAGAQS
jgi:hypothetical protein